MSLFRTVEVSCPVCEATQSFDMVFSVFADRRPDLRTAILDRTFQIQKCGSCNAEFRIEPEFTYVHLKGHQWIAAFPADGLARWASIETRSQNTFDRSYGKSAPKAAQNVGQGLSVRVTFGWEALREKLVAADAGIDDVTLELAKIALLRGAPALQADEDMELRLLAIEAGEEGELLQIANLRFGDKMPVEVLSVPRTLINEIEADTEGWKELREEVSAGAFVDMARMTIEPAGPGEVTG
ncbi:CpXC domain-containing protein [Radicibacter daui]|uniref:CpXC domain-containing protein n=1 Tax=Radicibacter daui TaxID=3064829 RepID=UPI0040469638